MDLARDEMAFRKNYETILINQELTTIFRPGNRLFPNYRGYKPLEIVTARVIEKVGCDERKIAPTFSGIKVPIMISDIRTIDINCLTPADFQGSSPDIQTPEELLEHLEGIYAKSIEFYDNKVTRIQIQYL